MINNHILSNTKFYNKYSYNKSVIIVRSKAGEPQRIRQHLITQIGRSRLLAGNNFGYLSQESTTGGTWIENLYSVFLALSHLWNKFQNLQIITWEMSPKMMAFVTRVFIFKS